MPRSAACSQTRPALLPVPNPAPQCGAEAIVDIATLTGACMVALGGQVRRPCCLPPSLVPPACEMEGEAGPTALGDFVFSSLAGCAAVLPLLFQAAQLPLPPFLDALPHPA